MPRQLIAKAAVWPPRLKLRFGLFAIGKPSCTQSVQSILSQLELT